MAEINREKDVCSYFEKKLDLYRRYLGLTEGLRDALMDREMGIVNEFLSKRQHCIRGIESIDTSISESAGATDKRRKQLSEEATPMINGYIEEIKEIMDKVDQIDRGLACGVSEEVETIKRELLRMRDFKKAARGYQSGKGNGPRFFDRVE